MHRLLFGYALLVAAASIVSWTSGQIVFPSDTGPLPETRSSSDCVTHDKKLGACKRLPECFFVYTQLAGLLQQEPCRLGEDPRLLGVCCPVGGGVQNLPPNGVSSTGTLFFRPPNVPIPDLKPKDIQKAAQAALVIVEQRITIENDLFVKRVIVEPDTAVKFHLDLFPTTPQTLAVGANAVKNLETSVQLVNQNKLTVDQGRFTLGFFPTTSAPQLADTCQPRVTCPNANSRYRSIDGACNNLQRPQWGQINTALQRIIPPKYGDGVNTPRLGQGDVPLPSARLVSQSLTETSQRSTQSEKWTLVLMQWGQFLDHDLTHSPLVRGKNSSGITCCRNGRVIDDSIKHPDCFPILIPPNDPFYGQFNQQCMEFVRSLPAVRPQCTFGPREQINQVTAFLDGSAVYGSTVEHANELREFRNGRLTMQRSLQGHSLLPVKPEECSDFLRQRFCFKAGDGRVNEQPQLAVMHTLWVREHNRIADALQKLNPQWDDERIYQESRRIVGAEIQQITFNEFLPILLGDQYMTTYKLRPLAGGDGSATELYDSNIDPSITNEFSTAAFRMGHSLVQGILEGFTAFGGQTHRLLLHQHQSKPYELYENGTVDNLVRGLMMQPAQRMDRAFTDELKNRLFQGQQSFGMDLIALNLQRGRDHGLPPYNDYRELCGKPRAKTWDDLLDTTESRIVDEMRRVYRTVEDVDLYIGAVSETPVDGAILGPTFLCLIGDQMARLRRGDRFYFEEKTAGFTSQQLASLRQVTLARILCDNGDDIKASQPHVFFRADFQNRRRSCKGSPEIPELDLNLWRE